MFSANRWEYKSEILENIQKNTIILDRYSASGVAYSAAKGLDLKWCQNNEVGLPQPDITFYLNISQNEQEKRN